MRYSCQKVFAKLARIIPDPQIKAPVAMTGRSPNRVTIADWKGVVKNTLAVPIPPDHEICDSVAPGKILFSR